MARLAFVLFVALLHIGHAERMEVAAKAHMIKKVNEESVASIRAEHEHTSSKVAAVLADYDRMKQELADAHKKLERLDSITSAQSWTKKTETGYYTTTPLKKNFVV